MLSLPSSWQRQPRNTPTVNTPALAGSESKAQPGRSWPLPPLDGPTCSPGLREGCGVLIGVRPNTPMGPLLHSLLLNTLLPPLKLWLKLDPPGRSQEFPAPLCLLTTPVACVCLDVSVKSSSRSILLKDLSGLLLHTISSLWIHKSLVTGLNNGQAQGS